MLTAGGVADAAWRLDARTVRGWPGRGRTQLTGSGAWTVSAAGPGADAVPVR